MRSNLWDDPRVAKLCDLTDSLEGAIIGGLYWLWSTADQHSVDGRLPGLTKRQLDRKTSIKGLADALLSIGWLTSDGEELAIPHFDEHNGGSAKKRAQTARRVAVCKATGNANHATETESEHEQVTQQSTESNAHSVTSALPRERERERVREREELSAHAGNADAQNPQPEPEQPKSRLPETGAPPTQQAAQQPAQQPAPPSPEGLACLAMRTAGLEAVNPSDPRLRELVKAGVQPEEFAAAATEAVAKGKKFAYALAVVAGRRTDAVQLAEAAARAGGPPPPRGAGALPGDIARTTVPGPKGRDPVLLAIEREAAKAVKPPPEIRAKLAALAAKRPTSAGAEA
ncbi:MAG: hypothetical protein WBK26_17035 [Burkholderiaceae bacterium]